MLRIHDIFGWIRIRIWVRGSMPLTNRSGFSSDPDADPDPAFFVFFDLQDATKKNNLKKSFSAYFLKVQGT
jgi:hypothetical protein